MESKIRSCITLESGEQVHYDTGRTARLLRKQDEAEKDAVFIRLQEALIAEQAVQCGYCYNGQIIKRAELLFKNPQSTEGQIRSAMNGHLCRCGKVNSHN